jgi:hypothetical protein
MKTIHSVFLTVEVFDMDALRAHLADVGTTAPTDPDVAISLALVQATGNLLQAGVKVEKIHSQLLTYER